MNELLAWLRRLFCGHRWRLEIVGMFDEEYVRCAKCGRERWTLDEDADF